jgi:hypothetical protein
VLVARKEAVAMKSGEKPPRGVKELVTRLAGANPRPTNKEIRETVQRKFEVALSDRTIARYCKDALLPTRSLRPDKSKGSGLIDADTARLKQTRQVEHIRQLQLLARSVRESVDQVPRSETEQGLDGEYISLTLIAYQLGNDALWPWLAHHLGDEAREIEALKDECGKTLGKISPEDRRRQVVKARQLLTYSLFPIAIYGDTEEWVAHGLNARCPGCVI